MELDDEGGRCGDLRAAADRVSGISSPPLRWSVSAVTSDRTTSRPCHLKSHDPREVQLQ